MGLALFGMSACSLAQSYVLVPSDSIAMSGWMEDNQTLVIQQRNISNDTIRFQWELVSEYVPSQWEASVCDNSFCYTSLVSSGTMTPVAPAESGKLLIRFTPHVNPGTAIVRYVVWNSNAPTTRDTLTFILTAASTSDITNNDNLIEVADHASYTVSVYAATGALIHFSSNFNETGDYLQQAPSGWYIAVYNAGTHITTRRIVRY